MKMSKIKESKPVRYIAGALTTAGTLVVPALAAAQDTPKSFKDVKPEDTTQTSNITTFSQLAVRATNIILIVIAALAVIFLVYGAIQYVTSRGDTQAAEKARNTITYAIIGIIIAILAYAIVNVVFNLVVTQS
jgi:amino acid transporter